MFCHVVQFVFSAPSPHLSRLCPKLSNLQSCLVSPPAPPQHHSAFQPIPEGARDRQTMRRGLNFSQARDPTQNLSEVCPWSRCMDM